MFCYTGGFSFYAMRGGATLVHSVDSSAKAIELTTENVNLNFPGDPRHQAFCEDAFKYLDEAGSNYDLIILDPRHSQSTAEHYTTPSRVTRVSTSRRWRK